MNITLNGAPCRTDAATPTSLLAFGEAELPETGPEARAAIPDNLPRLRREGRTMFSSELYQNGFLLDHAVATMAASHLDTGTIPEFMDEVLL